MSKGKLVSKIGFCVLCGAGILFSDKFQTASSGEQVATLILYLVLMYLVFWETVT